MKSGIYIIKNKINGKVYVGSAVDFRIRWNKHKSDLTKQKHHSKKLQRAWNKYGADKFEFIIIQNCNKEELVVNEQQWIDFYNSYYKGYNCTILANSSFGIKRSEETKKKLSKIFTGKKHSEESKQKIIKALTGKKHLQETKTKISKAHIGKKISEESKKKMSESAKKQFFDGKKSPMYEKKHTEESKKKMSESHIRHYKEKPRLNGIKHSEETKQKLSIAHKGKKLSDEHKAKISEARIKYLKQKYEGTDKIGVL